MGPFDYGYRDLLSIVALCNYKLLSTHLSELIRDLVNINIYMTGNYDLPDIGFCQIGDFVSHLW